MPINDLIDELVRECSDDVHEALQVLLLINERLEAELQCYRERSEHRTLH